ncbi:uncharacterized protein LOC124120797 [Haliotis rufescens]|uniref:uncharacterized protein LOC124120797 n=1 Tax=Haliotis rufescens TaxID=6454 RepID=UPI00201F9A7C|nr:uncharacterized protein LOC124120797 [Haliotis rufescens]
MWTMAVFPLLLCVLTPAYINADAAACTECTNAYSGETTDTDCTHLKTYLNCLEAAAGSSAGCTLTVAEATKIKEATCTAALVSPCSCQRTFWGSDLAGNRACEPLKTYIECLTDAGEADTCVAGVKASTLVLLPSARLETLTCNSGVSNLRMCSTILAFLPFILMAFLR